MDTQAYRQHSCGQLWPPTKEPSITTTGVTLLDHDACATCYFMRMHCMVSGHPHCSLQSLQWLQSRRHEPQDAFWRSTHTLPSTIMGVDNWPPGIGIGILFSSTSQKLVHFHLGEKQRFKGSEVNTLPEMIMIPWMAWPLE